MSYWSENMAAGQLSSASPHQSRLGIPTRRKIYMQDKVGDLVKDTRNSPVFGRIKTISGES